MVNMIDLDKVNPEFKEMLRSFVGDEELPDLTAHMTKEEKEKWVKRCHRDLDNFQKEQSSHKSSKKINS